ncbi:30S ribosomal protein S8 [Candidatus Peregrinibacteria bacterium CG_4_9_14_0_2_um_filter_41_14]|nr:MAG: 30S ribosomal protein S8 [Candidatus Peregrinibacteria bacterium CG_4_9_14_0_2_um_filter_41_14]
MYTDTIADLLTRIRNAQHARQDATMVPHSNEKESILKVLKENGYVMDYEIIPGDNNKKNIKVLLDAAKRNTVLKRVSTPGQRIYKQASEIKMVKSGIGINIISTSKGVMTGKEAKKQNLGGEVICQVY